MATGRARSGLAAIAVLLLCAVGASGVPVNLTTVAQLAAFAARGGTAEAVLGAHLVLEGTRIELASNASLTLRGDAAACGAPPADWPDAAGLCVIDANATSQHFVVSDGASLTLDGLALVNGASNFLGGAICVGFCAPEGNAGPDDHPVGAALSVYNSLLAYNTAGMPGLTAPVRAALLDEQGKTLGRKKNAWPALMLQCGCRVDASMWTLCRRWTS